MAKKVVSKQPYRPPAKSAGGREIKWKSRAERAEEELLALRAKVDRLEFEIRGLRDAASAGLVAQSRDEVVAHLQASLAERDAEIDRLRALESAQAPDVPPEGDGVV